jgi:integrase
MCKNRFTISSFSPVILQQKTNSAIKQGGLNMETKSSQSNRDNETSQTREEETQDSFRQNASFAEKNLLIEGIFSLSNDKYDVRAINRKKVENMLQFADIQTKEAPSVKIKLGRQGITEWIWKNKVLVDIPSTFLKSYLNKKKKIEAMHFYHYYRLVLEMSQQVAIFKQIPIEKVSDSDIFSEQTLNFLLENFATTIKKKQLIISIYKNVQETLFNDQTFPCSQSNNSNKEIPKMLHPRVTEFIKQMAKEGKANSTQKKLISYLKMFLPWLSHNMKDFESYEIHEIPTSKIKEIHLNEFRSYLLKKLKHGEYARVTVAECLYAVKQFFQFLERKYGFPTPARKLRSIKAPRYKYRDLPTKNQIITLLEVIDQYSDYPILERVAFRLMFSLGLRSIEITRLSWDDINLNTRTIRIHGKGNRYDILPLRGELYKELQMLKKQQLHSKYLLGSSINKNLRNLQENYKLYSLIAGWKFRGGLHLFRHFFITNLAKNRKIPQGIQKLARVEKPDTVSLYIHINKESTRLKEQINKLNYNKEDN